MNIFIVQTVVMILKEIHEEPMVINNILSYYL